MFQLVLQFRPWEGRRVEDFDELVVLEGQLESTLEGAALLDGHDIGAGEANVFIHCDDPVAIFETCFPVLGATSLLGRMSAAYRPLNGEAYTRLWPKDSIAEFIVR